MIRISLTSETDIAGWRDAARDLLLRDVLPASVEWNVAGSSGGLFAAEGDPLPPRTHDKASISKELLKEIETALLHGEPERFALAYRIVHPRADPARASPQPGRSGHPPASCARQIGAARHPQDARLRALPEDRDAGGRARGFRRLVRAGTSYHRSCGGIFFVTASPGMNWLIVTPEASIAWDGEALRTGPGGQKSDVPQEDAVEAEWKTYYASIFNPARLKTKAMMAEMPAKYWKNLPEAALIPELTREAETRMKAMIDKRDSTAIAVKEVEAPAHAEGGFTGLGPLYAALRAANDYSVRGLFRPAGAGGRAGECFHDVRRRAARRPGGPSGPPVCRACRPDARPRLRRSVGRPGRGLCHQRGQALQIRPARQTAHPFQAQQ